MENMNHDTYFSGGETRVFLPIWHNALDLHNIPLGHSRIVLGLYFEKVCSFKTYTNKMRGMM